MEKLIYTPIVIQINDREDGDKCKFCKQYTMTRKQSNPSPTVGEWRHIFQP